MKHLITFPLFLVLATPAVAQRPAITPDPDIKRQIDEQLSTMIIDDKVGQMLQLSFDLVASIVPDNKRLRCFTKIELQPGETKTVTFLLPAKELAFVNADCRWTLEEGDFLLRVGQLTAGIRCTDTTVWDSQTSDPPSLPGCSFESIS